jgi:hypothetical protein
VSFRKTRLDRGLRVYFVTMLVGPRIELYFSDFFCLVEDEYEIERDVLLNTIFEEVKDDVVYIFGDNITALKEERNDFKGGKKRSYDLLVGCDGIFGCQKIVVQRGNEVFIFS